MGGGGLSVGFAQTQCRALHYHDTLSHASHHPHAPPIRPRAEKHYTPSIGLRQILLGVQDLVRMWGMFGVVGYVRRMCVGACRAGGGLPCLTRGLWTKCERLRWTTVSVIGAGRAVWDRDKGAAASVSILPQHRPALPPPGPLAVSAMLTPSSTTHPHLARYPCPPQLDNPNLLSVANWGAYDVL